GDLGAWHVGKLPAEIEKAFTSMHFDEVGGPVETKYGFHVLHRRPSPADRGLQYRSPKGDPSLEEDMPENAEHGMLGSDKEQMRELRGEGHDEPGHEGHNH
ncbi:MAG: peptidylprolyl isomerase, partial [Proteobacteria bacterium]|nr:peptidylprolyl isomerase [Pseudomonadota bacterium]